MKRRVAVTKLDGAALACHDHGHGADKTATQRVDFDPTTEEFDPHPPGAAMKIAIAVAMVLAIAAASLYFIGPKGGWVAGMIAQSSAWPRLKGGRADETEQCHPPGDLICPFPSPQSIFALPLDKRECLRSAS